MLSKCVILKSRSHKEINKLFAVETRHIDLKNQDFILIVKVFCFSLDPVMNVWVTGAQTVLPKTELNQIFYCFSVGQVIKSNSKFFEVGDILFGNLGCTQISIIKHENAFKNIFKMPKELIEGFTHEEIVYLVNNGLTAYGGINLMKLKQSQTVVVSTAAGATGLLAIQILKAQGHKIIGLTSESKIPLIQKYCDIVVDYKNLQNLTEVLKKNKFSHYFDNVGEWMLDLIIKYINPYGTISLCGATANYLNFKQRQGIKNYSQIISKSLTLNGFNFYLFLQQIFEIFELFRGLKKKNQLQFIIQKIPIQRFPQYYVKLMKGQTIGKVIVTNCHQQQRPRL